jgi:hypothetical protein
MPYAYLIQGERARVPDREARSGAGAEPARLAGPSVDHWSEISKVEETLGT